MGMSSVDFDGEEDEDDDDGAAPVKPGKRVVREKKPPPVSDEGLLNVDPSSLARDQLVWAIGRASTLKISDEKLWKGFGKAIADLGEAHLEPSEVCRIMQAFAYAPTEAPLDDRQLQRLLKAFAARAAQYNDERLARMIYGYSKLASKRKLAVQRFLDFAASEVVERKAMAPWRKLWILRSAGHLPGVGQDFRALLVSQVMQRVGGLDTESWQAFIPMLVEHRLHERPGVVNALNKQYKFKIHCYKTPDFLLRSGLPMVLHDLMKTTTLALWLGRMHDLRLPLTAKMASILPPLPRKASAGREAGGDDDEDGSWEGAQAGLAKRAAENLEALKIAELCLRHERDATVVSSLPQRARHLLTLARKTPLEPQEEQQLLELPFVFGELGSLLRRLGIALHPTLCGPYLLELADPLGRMVVEWDANWLLYPPWRQKAHKDFVQRKHKHLRAEGWRVVCLPLSDFRRLDASREARLAWLRRAVEAHGLGHLSLDDVQLLSPSPSPSAPPSPPPSPSPLPPRSG